MAEWPDRAPHPESRGLRSYDGTRLRTAGALSYTYDAAGRIIERRKKRLSRKPDNWRYTWDAEDRLVSCTTPDGVLWTYTYDALSRRTAKRKHDADGCIVEETRFTWDGSRLAEQTDSATRTRLTWEYEGSHPIVQTEHRITAPPPRGAPDPEERPDAESAGSDTDARFFAIVTDLVGTPTDLVDDDGTITWQSRRAEWGSTAWSRTATAYTPLRFPGQYADPETGLHYNYSVTTTPRPAATSHRTHSAWPPRPTRPDTCTPRPPRPTPWDSRRAWTPCWTSRQSSTMCFLRDKHARSRSSPSSTPRLPRGRPPSFREPA